ncbi:galactokinase [Haliangium ochraceum]|uniref:Galactokinase n=1 Tax=Haliangium ochraceum (strain DSM 14365 / JCM 11303 / SMP-2) TaxID=502025 RepID=D0LM44_HALO1|nr:galactokinase [Haliangium ochraceum]ACY15222.1 galactokinase [Haliangium ochraceum DSM 14365]
MSPSTTPLARVVAAFRKQFSGGPRVVVRAPGRVNLIGEHTDYNDGFVLPMAIDRAVWIALTPELQPRLIVKSLDKKNVARCSLKQMTPGTSDWFEYIKGVAWVLGREGRSTPGWQGLVVSEVPMGVGLASSSALALAAMRAFVSLAAGDWNAHQMAALVQRAEREWVGVSCGILDPLASAAGRRGHVMLVDCRSHELEYLPMPEELAVVVLDTQSRRGLLDGSPHERRAQCQNAARTLGVPALRDATISDLERRGGMLDDTTLRRARHVITENARTKEAAEALRSGAYERLGELLDSSHESLRNDFEVSNAALDAMVRHARRHAACYGARLTGAGFGGCVVALVRREALAAFIDATCSAYLAETGRRPHAYPCAPADGAGVAPLSALPWDRG